MEQRRLRLGDILDDYCPRERRVTNHAVVAMVEEDVKQTRCTTCDAEHAYKGGREPRRRKKDGTSALYQEVLAGMPDVDVPASPPAVTASAIESPDDDVEDVEATAPENGNGHGDAAVEEIVVTAASDDDDTPAEADAEEPRQDDAEDGPFHRRLIRATLPRPEGQKEVRQVPDFTIRSNGNGSFRGPRSKMRGHAGNGNGHSNGNGGRRFAGGHGQGMPGGQGRGTGRPGFGGRGPSSGSGRGPSTGSGRGPGGPRKRSR